MERARARIGLNSPTPTRQVENEYLEESNLIKFVLDIGRNNFVILSTFAVKTITFFVLLLSNIN